MIKKRFSIRFILKTAFLFAAALLFLMPTLLTISNSFMSGAEISAHYGVVFAPAREGAYMAERINLRLIPDMVTLSQYDAVLLRTPTYLLLLLNSMRLVFPIVLVQVFVASFAAYSFTRWQNRWKEILFFTYIILMLMPFQVTLVPNFLVADFLGILDTRRAIWFPGFVAPFSVFLLTKFMRRIPVSYIEAAKLDGASEGQIFWKVALPLCRGALYAVVILVFIDYWNMVEQPLILMRDPDMHPLSVFLSRLNDANEGEIGIAFAAATIYMVPSLLMFLHGEEYLIEGITYSGGIKG